MTKTATRCGPARQPRRAHPARGRFHARAVLVQRPEIGFLEWRDDQGKRIEFDGVHFPELARDLIGRLPAVAMARVLGAENAGHLVRLLGELAEGLDRETEERVEAMRRLRRIEE